MSLKEDNPSPFTKRLKEARVNAKLSQKKLGILSGIDEFTASARMNQYEQGVHTPNYATVKHLAKVLNVPTSYMFEEDDEIAHMLMSYHQLNDAEKTSVNDKINNYMLNKSAE